MAHFKQESEKQSQELAGAKEAASRAAEQLAGAREAAAHAADQLALGAEKFTASQVRITCNPGWDDSGLRAVMDMYLQGWARISASWPGLQ